MVELRRGRTRDTDIILQTGQRAWRVNTYMDGEERSMAAVGRRSVMNSDIQMVNTTVEENT